MSGETIGDPKVVNLVTPLDRVKVQTQQGDLWVDMVRFAEVADRLGADKLDVLSINGFRNAKGELVPDYDSIRIERKAK